MIFQVKNEFFEKGVAKIKIPEKEQEQDLKDQVKSLTKAFSGLRLKISNQEKTKEELAINSFNGTIFLNNEKKNYLVNVYIKQKIIDFIYYSLQIKMMILLPIFIINVIEFFQM